MKREHAKALRLQAGMSQAEFGAAIGVTRETIGRMERGEEPITRRTELAMRYVAEVGPRDPRPLTAIHQEIADVLDRVAVRGRGSIDDVRQLKASAADWAVAGGGATAAGLTQAAQGVVGLLNVIPDRDPKRPQFLADLLEVKRAWRAVKPQSGSKAGTRREDKM